MFGVSLQFKPGNGVIGMGYDVSTSVYEQFLSFDNSTPVPLYYFEQLCSAAPSVGLTYNGTTLLSIPCLRGVRGPVFGSADERHKLGSIHCIFAHLFRRVSNRVRYGAVHYKRVYVHRRERSGEEHGHVLRCVTLLSIFSTICHTIFLR